MNSLIFTACFMLCSASGALVTGEIDLPGADRAGTPIVQESTMQDEFFANEFGIDNSVGGSAGDSVSGETVSDVPGEAVLDNVVVLESLEGFADMQEYLAVLAAAASVDAYQVSEYYREYFKGVLMNLPDTEYLCYAQQIFDYSVNRNITHYYLMYDLEIENDEVVPGSYPCIDVYNYNSVYYLREITKNFEGYPTIGFASFRPYSALIDRSVDLSGLYIGLICIAVFYILCRKSVFS